MINYHLVHIKANVAKIEAMEKRRELVNAKFGSSVEEQTAFNLVMSDLVKELVVQLAKYIIDKENKSE